MSEFGSPSRTLLETNAVSTGNPLVSSLWRARYWSSRSSRLEKSRSSRTSRLFSFSRSSSPACWNRFCVSSRPGSAASRSSRRCSSRRTSTIRLRERSSSRRTWDFRPERVGSQSTKRSNNRVSFSGLFVSSDISCCPKTSTPGITSRGDKVRTSPASSFTTGGFGTDLSIV